MPRWRRLGLSLTFAATLASGVLIAQPAQAYTLNVYQCARLSAAIDYLLRLQAQYPDNRLIAYFLGELKEIRAAGGCS
jgi:hypothetical protein